MKIPIDHVYRIDMRVGIIQTASPINRLDKNYLEVGIDFGSQIGMRKTILNVRNSYAIDELLGRQIIGIINIEEKTIKGIETNTLILGVPTENDGLSLIVPNKHAKLGGKVY